MRAIDGLISVDSTDHLSMALTGDGPKDRKILRAILERYPQPNSKLLWVPENVSNFGRGNRRTGRYAGFSALQPIKTFIGVYKIHSYLVLIDYEYINNALALNTQIESREEKMDLILIVFYSCPIMHSLLDVAMQHTK